MIRPIGALAVVAFLSGCAGYSEVYEYRLTSVAAPPRVAPEVYMRGTAPPLAPFTEMAVLQARSNESFPAAVAALQRRAGELGADALVDVRSEAGAFEVNVLGTAIVWLDRPAAGAPAR